MGNLDVGAFYYFSFFHLAPWNAHTTILVHGVKATDSSVTRQKKPGPLALQSPKSWSSFRDVWRRDQLQCCLSYCYLEASCHLKFDLILIKIFIIVSSYIVTYLISTIVVLDRYLE